MRAMVSSGSVEWPTKFAPAMRGTIGSVFYDAARAGASTPEAIVVAATQTLRVRYTAAAPERKPAYLEALESLVADRPQALAFATHALWRESLPPAERDRLRAEARRQGLNAVLGEQKEQR